MPVEILRRGCWLPQNWSNRWLWTVIEWWELNPNTLNCCHLSGPMYFFYVCVCTHMNIHVLSTCVEVKGQLSRVDSLLLPCRFSVSNPGCQTSQQVPLPNELSHSTHSFCSYSVFYQVDQELDFPARMIRSQVCQAGYSQCKCRPLPGKWKVVSHRG